MPPRDSMKTKRPNRANRHPPSPSQTQTTPPIPRAAPLHAPAKAIKIEQVVNCAECRRLKLRCNREWPCTNCVKRGCAQICPTGKMKTGKGKRMILADTEELHQRIAELEGALQRSHAQQSDEVHPLLLDSFQYAPQDESPALEPEAARPTVPPPLDSEERGTGLLLLGLNGESVFVGPSAGSEFFDLADSVNHEAAWATPPTTASISDPPAHTHGHFTSPIGIWPSSEDPDGAFWDMRQRLPDWETEGRQLIEQYWENVNWMHQIISRPTFDADHLGFVLDPRIKSDPHKLACVFFMMALGALFDLYREPYDHRATELFDAGQACLHIAKKQQPSFALVQALHLSATYILNSQDPAAAETTWPVLGQALKLAQSLGLHRDGERFGLSEAEVGDKRQVWWELVGFDRLQALCLGRPCATRNIATDTALPATSCYYADHDGFHRAKAGVAMLLEQVIDLQTSVALVAHSQVQEVDKALCRFRDELPATLLPDVPIDKLPMDSDIHPHMVIHRYTIRVLIAQARLALHRPGFAKALRGMGSDPSLETTGDGFVATYESAHVIVQCVQSLVIFHPSLVSRWWFFWFHAFSSAVCLAAIAIRTPHSPYAVPAFDGLCTVLEIAYATAPGCRARRSLPVLFRLRKKAAAALQAAGRPQSLLPIPFDRPGDDELRAEESRTANDLAHLSVAGGVQLGRLRPMNDTWRRSALLRLVGQTSAVRRHHGTDGVDRSSPVMTYMPRPPTVGASPSTEMRVPASDSPLSGSSFSASSTLAETVFFDSLGSYGPIPGLSGAGAVPLPPPADFPRTTDSSADTAWAHTSSLVTATWPVIEPIVDHAPALWTVDEEQEGRESQWHDTPMIWDGELERAFGWQPDLRFAHVDSSSPMRSGDEMRTPEADFDWSVFMNLVGEFGT